jgi:hypothetical protein
MHSLYMLMKDKDNFQESFIFAAISYWPTGTFYVIKALFSFNQKH